jgi:hypothetical protein
VNDQPVTVRVATRPNGKPSFQSVRVSPSRASDAEAAATRSVATMKARIDLTLEFIRTRKLASNDGLGRGIRFNFEKPLLIKDASDDDSERRRMATNKLIANLAIEQRKLSRR